MKGDRETVLHGRIIETRANEQSCDTTLQCKLCDTSDRTGHTEFSWCKSGTEGHDAQRVTATVLNAASCYQACTDVMLIAVKLYWI
jgi:hypothetical protein